MIKKLLTLVFAALLAACQSSGNSNVSWDRPGYSNLAQNAPSRLVKNETENQDRVYTPYHAPDQQQAAAAQPPPAVQQQQLQYQRQQQNYNSYTDRNNGDYYGGNAPMPIPRAMQSTPAVKIALLLPLSGKQSELGQSMLQAAQLALFDMGYEAFELIPRDTKGSPQEAAQAAQSAINAGAQLILGPVFAGEVRAVSPVAARAGVNVIGFSTDWSLAGNNVFIMGFLPFGQVQRVAEYAAINGARRIGVFAPDTEYGNAVVAAYNAAAARSLLSTISVIRYSADQEDHTAVLRDFTRYHEREQLFAARREDIEKRLKANPRDKTAKADFAALEQEIIQRRPFDAVLLPVGGEQARAIGNQLSFFDLSPEIVRRLGTGLWDDTGLATEKTLQGSWFAAADPGLRRDFETRYRDLYGMKPKRLSTLAYDATALAAVLAKKGFQEKGRPAYEHNDLINPNGFSGIDGIFRFRPDGLVERGLAVLEYRDMGIHVIDPAPHTFQKASY